MTASAKYLFCSGFFCILLGVYYFAFFADNLIGECDLGGFNQVSTRLRTERKYFSLLKCFVVTSLHVT